MLTATKRRQSDGELIRRAQQGDAGAFGEIWKRWYKRIHYFCCRRMDGDWHGAEEVASIVFLCVLRDVQRIDPERPFFRFVFKVARYKLFDYCRGERRYRKRKTDLRAALKRGDVEREREPKCDARLIADDFSRVIRGRLSILPDKMHDRISRHILQGVPRKDLGATSPAVAVSINVGLERLQADPGIGRIEWCYGRGKAVASC